MTLILNGKWINLSQMKVLIGRKWPKTAIYIAEEKKPNDHDDGLGPAWPEKSEMRTKNG